MNIRNLKILTLLIVTGIFINCTLFQKRKQVIITTEFGNIVIELYNETPKHRDNFIKLVKDSFYKDLLFHRVIKGFMIQGGDPDSRNAKPGVQLGEGGLDYTIQAEFNPKLYHKRGVLAAARESDVVNPTKASASTQFYIVQGKTFTGKDLTLIEEKKNKAIYSKKLAELVSSKKDTSEARIYMEKNKFKFSKKQRETYMKTGGAPHLDQNYTVFGEVKEGMEVVDKIANLHTDKNDRPLQDIRFTIKMKH